MTEIEYELTQEQRKKEKEEEEKSMLDILSKYAAPTTEATKHPQRTAHQPPPQRWLENSKPGNPLLHLDSQTSKQRCLQISL
ncbi:hypothetical protein FRB95_009047 [Tulasnella sp. JGI-2019a]|nr:hypothetical protein FRB95_009047 [Tulasnella sp. JGI-2019a]